MVLLRYTGKQTHMAVKNLLFLFTFCFWGYGFSQEHKIWSEVFFKTDSSSLSDEEYRKVKGITRIPDTIEISGIAISAYCDDVGNNAYNKILSDKRAGQIKTLFIALSVPEKLIDAKGNGEIALTGNENIEQARANNRKALITISYTLKQKEKTAEKPKEKPLETWGPQIKIPLTDSQKVGDIVTLENIFFIGGRHVILPESYDDLEVLAKTLLEKKKYHVMILGHICCVQSGKDAMDFDTGIANLSVARAKAIYNYLVKRGVSPGRLQYKGLKHDFPTGKGNMRDKRVEIEITKVVGE